MADLRPFAAFPQRGRHCMRQITANNTMLGAGCASMTCKALIILRDILLGKGVHRAKITIEPWIQHCKLLRQFHGLICLIFISWHGL
jgi:hypothetical protein